MDIAELVEFAVEINRVTATVRVNPKYMVFELENNNNVFVDFPGIKPGSISWDSCSEMTPKQTIEFARVLEAGSFIADYLNKV